jgi:hypothetical protein
MDVAAWLRGLGLGQYTKTFRDNDIDAAVLRQLTAEDLRELGGAMRASRRSMPSPQNGGGQSPASGGALFSECAACLKNPIASASNTNYL